MWNVHNLFAETNNDNNHHIMPGQMEISDKVRLADSLYTAYTLEETIYQLAKVSLFELAVVKKRIPGSNNPFFLVLRCFLVGHVLPVAVERLPTGYGCAAAADLLSGAGERLRPRLAHASETDFG